MRSLIYLLLFAAVAYGWYRWYVKTGPIRRGEIPPPSPAASPAERTGRIEVPAEDPEDWVRRYGDTPRQTDAYLLDIARHRVLSSKPDPVMVEALKTAPLVFGRIVKANRTLYADGSDAVAPMLVIFSDEPSHRTDLAYLGEVRDRLLAMAQEEDPAAHDADARAAAALVRDDHSTPDRHRLPISLAADGATFLHQVMITRALLPGGGADAGFVPGFTVDGGKGALRFMINTQEA